MKAARSMVKDDEWILVEVAATDTGLSMSAVLNRARRLGIELPVFMGRRHIRATEVPAIVNIALKKPWRACLRAIA